MEAKFILFLLNFGAIINTVNADLSPLQVNQIDILKQSILAALGMKEPPNITEKKSYTVPESLLTKYQGLLDQVVTMMDESEEDTFIRSRRNTQDYRKKSKKCRRHDMSVSVENLGWDDWLLAPKEFPINYCAGDCSFPLNDNQNATNHAIIQSIYGSMGVSGVPRACCTPTELAPLVLLFLDSENQPNLKNYQDMTVISCGCL